MKKILIIDDDHAICTLLKGFLERAKFIIHLAFSAGEALKKLKEMKYDLVLSDFRLPDFDGLKLFQKIKTFTPETPVIIMTSYANIPTAVKAIKMGAFEYVTKPLYPEEILFNINLALESVQTKQKTVHHHSAKKKSIEFVKGKSPNSLQIDQYVHLVGATELSVIIEGESGTGKEIIAHRIHMESNRKENGFIAVDCGALTTELAGSELFGHKKGAFTGAIYDKKGQFEIAQGGTLFLDEIGNLPYEIQVKLLRAIQERKIRKIGDDKDIDIDVRIVVATNDDLITSVSKGNFREDLFHRLNEFKITVPALRNREKDIGLFAKYFLDLSNKELNKNISGFSVQVTEIFNNYTWPGNLREMRNIIRRSVLLSAGEMIETDSLPDEILHDTNKKSIGNEVIEENCNLKSAQKSYEKELIISTLKKVKFNKSKAALLLNIDRKTLYNKIKQFNIDN